MSQMEWIMMGIVRTYTGGLVMLIQVVLIPGLDMLHQHLHEEHIAIYSIYLSSKEKFHMFQSQDFQQHVIISTSIDGHEFSV